MKIKTQMFMSRAMSRRTSMTMMMTFCMIREFKILSINFLLSLVHRDLITCMDSKIF